MKRHLCLAILLCLVATTVPASEATSETTSDEIDRTVWDVVSRTVVEHDIAGMAEVYHPDAVLVSSRGTTLMSDQLPKWGEGMEQMKRDGASATVSFRFHARQDGDSTAFESGVFRYAQTDSAGVESPAFVPFEALLVKKGGRWLMVMERQLEAVDEDAWNAME